MLEYDIRSIDAWEKNYLKAQVIDIEESFHCMYLISTHDSKFWEILTQKILDAILDHIDQKNAYKDFSRSLEKINAFLKNWSKEAKDTQLHAIIWIYNEKQFHFSHIGDASVLLGNIRGNIIEVTDKKDHPSDFHFISSGDVEPGETLILSTNRLLDSLSLDDVEDGLGTKHIENCWENIEHILMHEDISNNIACIVLRSKSSPEEESVKTLHTLGFYMMKFLDNRYTKKTLGYMYYLRDRVLEKQKHTVQIIFWIGMLLSILVLYMFVSSFFTRISSTQDVENLQLTLQEAQDFIGQATENINNIENYERFMQEAEKRIAILEEKWVYVNDIEKLRNDMSTIESQANTVQSFESKDFLHYLFPEEKEVVKLVQVSGKLYAVHERSVTWPIIPGQNVENYVYVWLSGEDSFIDATTASNSIVIQTKQGKVISFATSHRFSPLTVQGQDTWYNSQVIRSFNQNLYVFSQNNDQVYMHRRQGNSYLEGIAYLTPEDSQSLGPFLSMAIDGGFYLLKQDGMFLKFFRNPEYRIESLTLNRLPRNYIPLVTDPNNKIDMELWPKYIYLQIGDRVFIFEPNTNRVNDVKSLRFMGQIESRWSDIQAFYVLRDGDVYFADSKGIYRVSFDIEDFGVVIR